jgi:MFS family permease
VNAAVTQAGSPIEAVALRFATGAMLAGVYPPGMKIAAGWIEHRRGTALGLVIGALTIGSAVPHLLAWLPGESWRGVLLIASSLAVAGGAIVLLLVGDGPHVTATAPFDPRAALRLFTHRATRLALLGYLGHMWELYAMWTWVAAYVTASVALRDPSVASRAGSLGAFLAIASGAVGCVLAGLAADRLGKARVAAWAMMVSATCAAFTAIAFTLPPVAVFLLVIVWGFSIVADSAQFSALVSQFSPRDYVGTALTIQTCAGFLLTMIPIRLLPGLADIVGWRWVFLVLLPGPMLGVVAMLRLMTGPGTDRPA